MPQINSETILEYLSHIEWSGQKISDTLLLTGLRAPRLFYFYTAPIEIHIGEHWIKIRAYLQFQVAHAQRTSVLRYLSHLNSTSHLVRFFIVDNCVLAQTEVPVLNCNAVAFLDNFVGLCHYVIKFGIEIAMLATNPAIAKLYETIDASSTPEPLDISDREFNFEFDISANRLT